jgi:hypothetical protein
MAEALTFNTSYTGPIVMKFKNWDVGVLYDVDQDGDGLPDVATYTDAGTLNGLTQLAPTGAKNPLVGEKEDSWGVFRLDSITDPTGTIDLWNRFTATTEITGIFWGEHDVYMDQTVVTYLGTDYVSQDIHGVGMHIAFFEQAKLGGTVPNPYPVGGIAAARTAPGAFTTFTDGTLIWSMNSVPGHDTSFPTHEFFANFWPDDSPLGGNASGGFFADMGAVDLDGDGGADVGTLNWLIDTNPTPDFQFAFTGDPDGTFTWIVISDDPIRTSVIPEPLTMFGVFGAASALVGYMRRRRRV